ncbi:MAG: hypothetical protein JNK85_20380 [Verrucomicrobiales bacterium]|nr:hypothetical protein [Verrucomicrobiales bacterium]
MNRLLRTSPILALVAVAAMAPNVQADILLSPGATWEFTTTDPTGDATWNTTTGSWATGPAPFGNVFSGDFGYEFGTLWEADGDRDDDLWVRTSLDLSSVDLTSLSFDLGVDNGYKLYANGTLIASDNAEGYTSRWEYSGAIPPGSLLPGINVFAVALEDHGGLTAFDMQIRGEHIPAVPEASNVLAGSALVGLACSFAIRRRRAAAH